MKTQCDTFTSGALVVVKVALILPAGTVTLGGTMTWPSMLALSVTTAPPAGAADVSVTVPTVVPPASTDELASVKDDKLGAGVCGRLRRFTFCEHKHSHLFSAAVWKGASTPHHLIGLLGIDPKAK